MSFLTKLQTDRRCEILAVVMLALTTMLFLALVTDEYRGSIPRPLGGLGEARNLLGTPGAMIAGVLCILIGHAAHVLYILTFFWGMMLFRHRPIDRIPARLLGAFILTGAIAALLHIDLSNATTASLPGGAIGAFLGDLLKPAFGVMGSNVIAITFAVVGILLATEFLFVRAFNSIRTGTALLLSAHLAVFQVARDLWRQHRERTRGSRRRLSSVAARVLAPGFPGAHATGSGAPEAEDLSRIRVRPDPTQGRGGDADTPFDALPGVDEGGPEGVAESAAQSTASMASAQAQTATAPAAAGATRSVAKAEEPGPIPQQAELELAEAMAPAHASQPAQEKSALPRRKTAEEEELPPDYVYPSRYTKPPLDLLESPPPSTVTEDLGERLRHISLLLERALEHYGVEAKVTDVTRGPTITRFELEPAPGVKVSRFLSLADDLALALKAHGVRVEAPIPGKGRVGIELPNAEREPVVLRELVESRDFKRSKGRLTFALGKGIAGDVIVPDLVRMPHMLIAGATGAGKTVCVKSILASLLVSKTPEELQLMLIDPKMVELAIFNDIPHLITPVVTDAKKASSSLNWLIAEMEERYHLFAHLRVRNIEVYNESVENGEIEMPQAGDGGSESMEVIRKLPYIVCVIDELADLMMLARSEVENGIARLAQLSRAVGIHLVIATQRPSVDVLTGVIKANFPARISFQVSSRVDSRCILDEIGAERLIGNGDMLYLPGGQSKPTRIQGAFVSDSEMNSLIAYLKTQAPPRYRDEIVGFGKSAEDLYDLEGETDEIFDEAVRVVLETGQASISMVQRRLRVGYTRAARLIDLMELRGIVGPHLGSKARDILVDIPPSDEEI